MVVETDTSRGMMRKAADYRRHAEECRILARNMAPGEQRDLLLNMAQTWESLASDRERDFAKRGITPEMPGRARNSADSQ
jgi:hypothetical protein